MPRNNSVNPNAVVMRILRCILLYQQLLNLIQKYIPADTAVSDVEVRAGRKVDNLLVFHCTHLFMYTVLFQCLSIRICPDDNQIICIQLRQSLIGYDRQTDGILLWHIGRLFQSHILIQHTSDTGSIKYKQLSSTCQQGQIGCIAAIGLLYCNTLLLAFSS